MRKEIITSNLSFVIGKNSPLIGRLVQEVKTQNTKLAIDVVFANGASGTLHVVSGANITISGPSKSVNGFVKRNKLVVES